MRYKTFAITFLIALMGSLAPAWAQHLAPSNLRTEYLRSPLGVDSSAPRLGWWMNHEGQGQLQSAFQVQVAQSKEALIEDKAEMWDSQRIPSSENVHVIYHGDTLQSFTRYYWRVRLWDSQDQPSPWSEAAFFETALLKQEDNSAQWIRAQADIPEGNGYQSKHFENSEKRVWVRVDLGKAIPVKEIVLYPARPYDIEGKPAGYGFPLRYTLGLSQERSLDKLSTVADRSDKDQPKPGLAPVHIPLEGQLGRYIVLDVSHLREVAPGKFSLALAEMEVLDEAGNNVAFEKTVEASSRFGKDPWKRIYLVDGVTQSQQGKQTSPLLRKPFSLKAPVRRARAYVSGLGYYELYLNGQRVGDHVLDPANTVHKKRTLYSTFDVTEMLQEGENVAGMMLGHGWWPKTCAAWLMLRMELEDGTVEVVNTDSSWLCHEGPIVQESLYHGEIYNARKEIPEWNLPAFNPKDWYAAAPFEFPPLQLKSQMMPPIRVTEERRPVSVTKRSGGSLMLDFGQNMTGWVRMRIGAPEGTQVTLNYAELLHEDGSLNQENLRGARATDSYICKGGGLESYAPRFTQHGFRYVEVFGYPEAPPEDPATLKDSKEVDLRNTIYETISTQWPNLKDEARRQRELQETLSKERSMRRDWLLEHAPERIRMNQSGGALFHFSWLPEDEEALKEKRPAYAKVKRHIASLRNQSERSGQTQEYMDHFEELLQSGVLDEGILEADSAGKESKRLMGGALAGKDTFVAEVVHSDFERAGLFTCSDTLFNSIRDISHWSIRGNSMSIPTDCPQRDERMGWMGDAHLAAETTILQFDAAAYYENWLRVIANSQDEEGHIPDTAPRSYFGHQDGSPPWAIAYPLISWYSWRYYGNRRVIEEHYDNIVRWFATLEGHAKDHLVDYCHYGDWVGVEKSPLPPIGTGCYYWTAKILEEFAQVLDKKEDQAKFAQRQIDVAKAYNEAYFNQEKGYYDEGSQFSQVWPLYLGIAGEHTEAALKRLKHEIIETRQGHLATGILGTKYLFDVLTDSGNADLAFNVAQQEEYPGWGYMLANGATTLWELWRLETGGGMNSHNHQMFASIVDWFFGDLAGLQKMPEAGYQRFVVAPQLDLPLTTATAYVDTVRGRVAVSWSKDDEQAEITVRIPHNATARLVLPAWGELIRADKLPFEYVAQEVEGAYHIELASGIHQFILRRE